MAKESRLPFGGLGGWGVFAAPRFPVPRPDVWGKIRCASWKFHKSLDFWTFKVSPIFVWRGRRMWICLPRCGKSFFFSGAIHLQRCQHMAVIFRGRRSTLDVPHWIFCGRPILQTCRVACFSYIALAGLRAMATTCKILGRRGTSLHVSKLGKSRTKCSFWGLHVCPCLVLAAQLLWGKLRSLTFQNVSEYPNSCKFRTKMRVLMPACVWCCWLFSGCAVTMEEAAMPYVWESFILWNLLDISHEVLVLILAFVLCWLSGGSCSNISVSRFYRK